MTIGIAVQVNTIFQLTAMGNFKFALDFLRRILVFLMLIEITSKR